MLRLPIALGGRAKQVVKCYDAISKKKYIYIYRKKKKRERETLLEDRRKKKKKKKKRRTGNKLLCRVGGGILFEFFRPCLNGTNCCLYFALLGNTS